MVKKKDDLNASSDGFRCNPEDRVGVGSVDLREGLDPHVALRGSDDAKPMIWNRPSSVLSAPWAA